MPPKPLAINIRTETAPNLQLFTGLQDVPTERAENILESRFGMGVLE